MAERRQPDYDFFGPGQGPGAGAPSSSGAPGGGAPYTPPVRPPAAWSPQHAGGPAEEAASGTGGPAHHFALSGRSRASTVVIAFAVVVCTLAFAGVLAAVALPVLLHQRVQSNWERTRVALPATFDGVPRGAVPETLRPEAPSGEVGHLDAASYRTTEGATLYVLAGKTAAPSNETDQVDGRRQMSSALVAAGVDFTLAEADPGQLGGWLGCGTTKLFGEATVCIATDHASVVVVVARGSADPAADARRIREQTVRR